MERQFIKKTEMSNVAIYILVDLKEDERSMFKIAELYCQIWREPPWNENCWQPGKVLDDMKEELRKPGAVCVFAVAVDTDQIVGFSWGYLVNKDELKEIAGHDKLSLFPGYNNRAFYIDEMAIASEYRRKGVAGFLTEMMLSEIDSLIKFVLVRTDVNALPARKLYSSFGFKEIPVRDVKYPDRSYWCLKL